MDQTMTQDTLSLRRTHDGPGKQPLAVERATLERAVRKDPRSEAAWLRLAAKVERQDERRYCLARALSINGENLVTRNALRASGAGPMRSPLSRVGSPVPRPSGHRKSVLQTIRDYPVPVLVIYLVAITVTEFLTLVIDPRVGLWGHSALLVVLIVHSALVWRRPFHKMVLTMAFAPLIRLVSLALPLAEFPLIYWYLLTSLPLFVTAFLVVQVLGFSRDKIALTSRKLGTQLLVGMTGLVLGYVEYRLLRPEPLFESLAWRQMVIPSLILMISTGFIEELIFRGIMQRAASECLGASLGSLYVAAIFAMMHMGHSSWPDILFVFGVSVFFSWVVARTRSLLGVTLAHGLTNILLFLILPTLDQMYAGWWLWEGGLAALQ